MKKINIIGSGFSGLSLAYHLLKLGWEVSILDKAPIGSSTSAMAAGLLHLYTGKKAKRSAWGTQALIEAQKLLEIAGSEAILQTGLLRVGIDREYYTPNPELEWWPKERCAEEIEGLIGPGIWIRDGLAIDANTYIQGLWQACQQLGAHFKLQEIRSINPEEKTVVCAGFESAKLLDLPIRPLKGQLLHLKPLTPLPYALNGHGYLLQGRDSWIAGSTFERGKSDVEIDPDFAKEQVLAKIRPFYPKIDDTDVINVAAGVRGHLPNHLPIYRQLDKNLWAFTALGSKGLLVSALLAKQLSRSISEEDQSYAHTTFRPCTTSRL